MTSGHGGGATSSTRERACSAAKDQAEGQADAAVRYQKRREGKDTEALFSNLTSEGDCTDCRTHKIYGNPTEHSCIVRWRLRER